MDTNAAWARFLRTLGAAANQLAADLTQASAAMGSALPATDAPPALLAIGERQKAIAALPDLRSEGGLKTAQIAHAVGSSDVPNIYQAMRALEKRGLVELIPNRAPQRWRLAARYRE